MPSTYFYLRDESEQGPVDFRQLVSMVRQAELSADDLVRADWQIEWHPAAKVIGLFHMAGRADVLAKWEARQAAELQRLQQEQAPLTSDDDLDLLAILDAAEPATPSPANWERRMREQALHSSDSHIGSSAGTSPNSSESPTNDEDDREAPTGLVRQALHSAMDQFDQKLAVRQRHSRSILLSGSIIRWCLRSATAALLIVLSWKGVMLWSEREMMRYPDPQFIQAGVKIFPGIGHCTPLEFQFLMVDTALVAGAAGYYLACFLEQWTD